MKKLNSPLYVILIVISAFCTTSCGKNDGGDSGSGGGGVAVLLGDLFGFWQSGNDSFTFNGLDNQLGGTGTIGGKTGTVSNGKINKTIVTFDLVFDDNSGTKSYSGTIDATKTKLKLTSGSTTATFTKQP